MVSVYSILPLCKFGDCKTAIIWASSLETFCTFLFMNSISTTKLSISTTHTCKLISTSNPPIVHKNSLSIPPTHLVILDPSNEIPTNVTPNCFMVAQVFMFLSKFGQALLTFEESLFEEARTSNLLGKFRDLDAQYAKRIDKNFGSKSAWLFSLFGVAKPKLS